MQSGCATQWPAPLRDDAVFVPVAQLAPVRELGLKKASGLWAVGCGHLAAALMQTLEEALGWAVTQYAGKVGDEVNWISPDLA